MSEPASVLDLAELMRVAGSLVLVAALVVVSGFVARRRMNRSASRSLRVDERLTLARGVQLALVAHEERRLLVGVCDKGVQLVADLGVPESAAEESVEERSAEIEGDRSATAVAGVRRVTFAERLAERLVAHLPGAGRHA